MGTRITSDQEDEREQNLPYPRDGIYFGTVRHRRMISPMSQFQYKTSMAFLEIQGESISPQTQDKLSEWSKKMIRFYHNDYLPMSDLPLEQAIRQTVSDRLGFYPTGRVFLLSHLRTAGWNFNPISIYYVFAPEAEHHLEALVMEVTNTPWNQRYCYVMPVGKEKTSGYTFDKKLHVSPYLPMDVIYKVIAGNPGKKLNLHFGLQKNENKIFDADLFLRFEELNKDTITKMLIKTPLPPMKTSLSIYWQALLLKARGAKWYRHPEKIAEGHGAE
ncbi:MAG: DUF1365 domain-containing protein [Firmicutes bacterium]|nr:DUF1365 domain-containing protein [Bacillota bacterium]